MTKELRLKGYSMRLLTLAPLILLATGCPDMPDPSTRSTIFVINESEVPIIEFNMLLTSEPPGWGTNWLIAPLEPGEIYELGEVPGGIYDLRASFNQFSFVKSVAQTVEGGLYTWTINATVLEEPQLVQVDEPPDSDTPDIPEP